MVKNLPRLDIPDFNEEYIKKHFKMWNVEPEITDTFNVSGNYGRTSFETRKVSSSEF